MSTWSADDLRHFEETDDLHISPLREDRSTYGTPTWIWSVVINDALYARAYNGTASSWFKAAIRQKAGRITSGESTREVAFKRADDAQGSQIDDAYRAKYANNPYLPSMIGDRARSATVEILPK